MRSFIIIGAILLAAGSVQAKPADIRLTSVHPGAVHEAASPLLATARALIRGHLQERGLYRPLAPAHAVTADVATARIAALAEADRYARTIVAGLSAAANGEAQRAALQEELAPALADLDAMNFAALTELLDTPDAAAQGWFAASRFGANTERMAGALLTSARGERSFLAALRERIARLAQDGEASPETLAVITGLLEHPAPNLGRLGADAGEQG